MEGNLGILQCDMVPKAGGEASMAASPLCAPVFRGTQESVGGILTPGVAGVQAVQGWPNTGSFQYRREDSTQGHLGIFSRAAIRGTEVTRKG